MFRTRTALLAAAGALALFGALIALSPLPGIAQNYKETLALYVTDVTDGQLPQRSGNTWTTIAPSNLGPTVFDVPLSGSADFKAGGDGTSDPVSGLTVHGTDVSGATQCEIASNLLQVDLSAAGADKNFYLVRELASVGFPDLYQAQSVAVTIEWDLDIDGGGSATNFDTADDLFWVQIANEDTQAAAVTESPYLIFRNDGGANRSIGAATRLDNTYTVTAWAAVANWDHAGHVSMRATMDNVGTSFYDEDTPLGYYSAVHHPGEWHVRPTANSGPYLVMWFRAKDGGRVAMDISAIRISVL